MTNKDNTKIAGIIKALENQQREVKNMTENSHQFSVGGSVGRDINNYQGDRIIQGNNQGVFGDKN